MLWCGNRDGAWPAGLAYVSSYLDTSSLNWQVKEWMASSCWRGVSRGAVSEWYTCFPRDFDRYKIVLLFSSFLMSLLLIHYPLTATERDKSESRANPPFFQLLLSNSSSHLYISTSWLTFQDILFLQRCLLQKEHVLNPQIVRERREWDPTLCEVHDVVERRTGWKTHIFTITNILATILSSTEVSSNRWRITIGNRDWGESGDQIVKESKNHWKELAKWTTNFDTRTSGSHVCRRFTTKTQSFRTMYFTAFHYMSTYKTLDNPSDSSNERSEWEQRRLTDDRNHIVSGLMKQRRMLLVRDWEIYP